MTVTKTYSKCSRSWHLRTWYILSGNAIFIKQCRRRSHLVASSSLPTFTASTSARRLSTPLSVSQSSSDRTWTDSRTSAGGSDCPSCVKHWCGVKWGYVWATRPPLLLPLLLLLWRQWTLCAHSQPSLGTSQITATTKTERFITDTSDVIVLVADRFRNHGTNSRLALPVARHSLYRLTTI